MYPLLIHIKTTAELFLKTLKAYVLIKHRHTILRQNAPGVIELLPKYGHRNKRRPRRIPKARCPDSGHNKKSNTQENNR